MPRTHVRHQPALADSTDSMVNDHCAATDNAVSANKRAQYMKRRSASELSITKYGRHSDRNDCTVNTSLQAGEKPISFTDFKKCTADINNVPSSSDYSTLPVQQQFSDHTPNGTLRQRLLTTFFDQPCVELARNLLGKSIVRISPEDGERLSGRIVETEAYVGTEDRASHSYNGRRTARNEAMFMPPGTSYVYNIYGIYTCINISSRGL